ncbi:ABC transporter substrate-binding protein [Humidisolicoccus flavus]|uniref:ABC transporter substrate-binding protein n=1 Tax=Humidisolicoccus flavus TaxID=3111414 RepID=UPI0032453C40
MTWSKKFAAASIALLLTASVAGCSAGDPESSGGADNAGTTQVKFGLPTNMGANNAPLAVAQGLGYFEDEGLDVEIVNTGGSSASLQAVLSGQLDIGSATPEPILQFVESGGGFGGVTMFYNYVRQPTGSLAVLASSDVQSLEDFAGLTIGNSSLGSGNLILANGILDSVGLEPDVDFSHIAVGTGAAALQALESGQVGALSLWDTEYAAMEVQGVELRTFTSPEAAELFSTTYFSSPKYIEDNPEVIEAFGRAMARATHFTSLDPTAALKVMYETFPETRTGGLDEAAQLETDLVALNARLELLLADDPIANGNWGEYSPSAVESWTSYAFTSEIVTTELNADELYTNDFVEAYNDFDPAEIEADVAEFQE